jgi:hypothetical protein
MIVVRKQEVAKAEPSNTVVPHSRNIKIIPAGSVPHSPGEAEAYARVYREWQKSYATELSTMHQRAGDAVAIEFASRSAGYPSLWRRQ